MDNIICEIGDKWLYTAHLVVKYKPENYNEKGHYTKDEWGSMGDVGRVYDGHLVTLDEYLEVEQQYVDAVVKIMELVSCKYLTVTFLGDTVRSTKSSIRDMLSKKNRFLSYDKVLYDSYMGLVEGKRIYVADIPSVVRLNLREYTNTTLTNLKKGLEIHFGYDYYMYFNTKLPIGILREEIRKIGLYLDPRSEAKKRY